MAASSLLAGGYDSRMARPRIQADVSEEVRRAILIVAAESDTSAGEIVEQLVRQAYPQHVKRAAAIIAKKGEESHPPPPPKAK